MTTSSPKPDPLRFMEAIWNPCNPVIMARAVDKIISAGRKTKTTADVDIRELRYLLIDCDPKRPSGISSTDEELHKAQETINEIINDYGTPLIQGMSGNGFHTIFPHDATDKRQLGTFLKFLDDKYGNNGVNIDVKVANPSRITKVLGTWARKGESTQERPHRQSRLLFVNENPVVLKIPIIQEKTKKTSAKSASSRCLDNNRTDNIEFVQNFLNQHNILVKKEHGHDVGHLFVLEHCHFDSSHKGGEASIIVQHSGKILYQCFQASCHGRTWNELRENLEGARRYLCKYCGKEITWTADRIPLNLDGSRHNCKSLGQQSILVSQNIQEDIILPATNAGKTMAFPTEALPEIFREFSLEVSKAMSCPIDLIAIPAIVCCGAAIGNTRKLLIKNGHVESAILYAATVAPPGSTKSAAIQVAVNPLETIDSRLVQQYRSAVERKFVGLITIFVGLLPDIIYPFYCIDLRGGCRV